VSNFLYGKTPQDSISRCTLPHNKQWKRKKFKGIVDVKDLIKAVGEISKVKEKEIKSHVKA